MNTRTRYLVLNSRNEAQNPSALGLHLPGVQSAKSPSILDLPTAKLFAGKLAAMHKGQNFYVAQTLGGAVAFDVLAENSDPKVTVSWADATATGTDAE